MCQPSKTICVLGLYLIRGKGLEDMAGVGSVLLPLHDVGKGHLVSRLAALDNVLVGVVKLLLTIVGHIRHTFRSCVCVVCV